MTSTPPVLDSSPEIDGNCVQAGAPAEGCAQAAAPKGLSYVPQLPAAKPGTPDAPSFPDAKMVSAAASMFAKRTPWTARRVDGLGPEGREFRASISGGTFGIGMTDPARSERNRADGLGNTKGVRPGMVLGYSVDSDSGERVGDGDDEWSGEWREPEPSRQIGGWSPKSRARMTRRLAQLDWSPMYAAGRPAVMVTLTYPGDWETVVPDGKTAKRHLRNLGKRYLRAWGAEMVGPWKLEFQARGAPHFHLLIVPPVGSAPCPCPRRGCKPVMFRDWLSITWAAIVNHPDPAERLKHLKAGTGLDYLRGGRCFDPKRAALYFSKHSGAAGGKEYQHQVPEAWQEPGRGPGRFWGYWGLKPVVQDVTLSLEEYLALRRTMRRWSRAQGMKRVRTVPRVDAATGVVRARRVTRRWAYLSQGGMQGGTLVVNDGPAFAAALARALERRG